MFSTSSPLFSISPLSTGASISCCLQFRQAFTRAHGDNSCKSNTDLELLSSKPFQDAQLTLWVLRLLQGKLQGSGLWTRFWGFYCVGSAADVLKLIPVVVAVLVFGLGLLAVVVVMLVVEWTIKGLAASVMVPMWWAIIRNGLLGEWRFMVLILTVPTGVINSMCLFNRIIFHLIISKFVAIKGVLITYPS